MLILYHKSNRNTIYILFQPYFMLILSHYSVLKVQAKQGNRSTFDALIIILNRSFPRLTDRKKKIYRCIYCETKT